MSSPAIFPLDLTGESTTNRVEENYTITQMLGDQYFQFKFRHGPSFNNVKLIHVETGRELKPQIDYQLTYLFKEATNKYREVSDGKEIYSACVILNKKLSGNVLVTLQYLGGVFSNINSNWIPDAVNKAPESFTIEYDSIIDIPAGLPPTTHLVHPSEANKGFEDVTQALFEIEKRLIAIAPVGKFNISDIVGLTDELDSKVDYRNSSKTTLACKSVFEGNTLEAQIQIILPKPNDIKNFITTTIEVYTQYEAYRLRVSGIVSNKGYEKGVWDSPTITIEGTNTELPIYCTYNEQGSPTVYIGKSVIGKTTVSITDYTTTASDPENMVDGFYIAYTDDDLSGFVRGLVRMDNTHLHANILNPTSIDDSVHLNTLTKNEFKTYYPSYRNGAKLLENGFPLEDPDCRLTIQYTNDNVIEQTISYTIGTYKRFITTTDQSSQFTLQVDSDSGNFKVQRYCEVTVNGESNEYYPVLFRLNSLDKPHDLNLGQLEFDFGFFEGSSKLKVGSLYGHSDSGHYFRQELWNGLFEYYNEDTKNPLLGVIYPGIKGKQTVSSMSGLVFYVKGGTTLKGYSNANRVQTLAGNSLTINGITLPTAVSAYSDITQGYKVTQFGKSGTYRSLANDFAMKTSGVSVELGLDKLTGTKGKITIFPWSGTTPPEGYVMAFGDAYDANRYPGWKEIFPDGYIVNLRGRVLKGASGEEKVLQFEEQALLNHTHTANAVSNTSVGPIGAHNHAYYTGAMGGHKEMLSKPYGSDFGTRTHATSYTGGHTPSVSVTTTVAIGASGGEKNIVDNVGINWIIKIPE